LPQIDSDLDATAAWAGRNRGDPRRLGITGFCHGGRLTWLYAAHSATLKAAVAWYGPFGETTSAAQPLAPLDVVGKLNCPVLGLYAGKDPSTTPAQIAQAEAEAKAAGKTVAFVVFPDAMHGFHADWRPSYNAADAADGWARMLAWLRRYGVA
jgi:carboxymethylenebutenolidase